MTKQELLQTYHPTYQYVRGQACAGKPPEEGARVPQGPPQRGHLGLHRHRHPAPGRISLLFVFVTALFVFVFI